MHCRQRDDWLSICACLGRLNTDLLCCLVPANTLKCNSIEKLHSFPCKSLHALVPALPSTLPATTSTLPSSPPPSVRGAGLPVPQRGHPPAVGRGLPHHLVRGHPRPGSLCAQVRERCSSWEVWLQWLEVPRSAHSFTPDCSFAHLLSPPDPHPTPLPSRRPAACPSGGRWTRRRRRCAPAPSPARTSRRSGPRTCTSRGWPTAAQSASPPLRHAARPAGCCAPRPLLLYLPVHAAGGAAPGALILRLLFFRPPPLCCSCTVPADCSAAHICELDSVPCCHCVRVPVP